MAEHPTLQKFGALCQEEHMELHPLGIDTFRKLGEHGREVISQTAKSISRANSTENRPEYHKPLTGLVSTLYLSQPVTVIRREADTFTSPIPDS